jgi:superfamily II DNA helicase RecQ
MTMKERLGSKSNSEVDKCVACVAGSREKYEPASCEYIYGSTSLAIVTSSLSNLPSGNGIAMYHARTPQGIKDTVLSDLMRVNGFIRIIIATSALGMGVNIPNIFSVLVLCAQVNMIFVMLL